MAETTGKADEAAATDAPRAQEGAGGEEEEEEAPRNFDWMPEGCAPLADGEYDAIVMGTGLTECAISGLLATMGMKVLHIDRNGFYGSDTASLSLPNLYEKFRGTSEFPAELGSTRDYNIDLVPKLIMACGSLVKILLHTKVSRYLEFKSVSGSYVLKDGSIHKVPATPGEATHSQLMGWFEKGRFRGFLQYLAQYNPDEPRTHKGRNLEVMTMRELYHDFGLDENTQSFTGHAMALQRDDSYLDRPALPTVNAIKLYVHSLEQYGTSPYIYPMYGLGGLAEGFSRLCAIHNGTFMLNQPVDRVLFNDETGEAWGIQSGSEVAKAPMIIGEPAYFPPEKCRHVGQVVRSICILDHPIRDTNDGESVQLIIPARQVNRNHDIYVCMASHAHEVSAEGKYIAIASTTVENPEDPVAELAPALQLLEPILERFDNVSDQFQPIDDGTADRCFISSSYDATSHFETASADILSLYERVTGEQLDMSINADTTDPDA